MNAPAFDLDRFRRGGAEQARVALAGGRLRPSMLTAPGLPPEAFDDFGCYEANHPDLSPGDLATEAFIDWCVAAGFDPGEAADEPYDTFEAAFVDEARQRLHQQGAPA